MNSLNSILLEGELIADPEQVSVEDHSGEFDCRFNIECLRFYRRRAGTLPTEEQLLFEVEARGKLAVTCIENLKAGKNCRVVGRLSQREIILPEGVTYQKTIIYAEHVEFKPHN